MKKYFGKFASSGDVQTAVENKELLNPYVAIVGNEVDYNSNKLDYSKLYFTIEMLEDGDISSHYDLFYSVNGGAWTRGEDNTMVTFHAGDKIRMYGSVEYGFNSWFSNVPKFNVYGNVLSLVKGTAFTEYDRAYNVAQGFFNSFKGSNVVDASNLVLPTTTATMCYGGMFQDCKELIAAPRIEAATLASSSCQMMYYGCSKLQNITCLATDISASNCLLAWTYQVSATGTFVKKAGVNWPSGIAGIPNGWTVIEE